MEAVIGEVSRISRDASTTTGMLYMLENREKKNSATFAKDLSTETKRMRAEFNSKCEMNKHDIIRMRNNMDQRIEESGITIQRNIQKQFDQAM